MLLDDVGVIVIVVVVRAPEREKWLCMNSEYESLPSRLASHIAHSIMVRSCRASCILVQSSIHTRNTSDDRLTWHPTLVDIFAGDISMIRIAIAPIHGDSVAIDARNMSVIACLIGVFGPYRVADLAGLRGFRFRGE